MKTHITYLYAFSPKKLEEIHPRTASISPSLSFSKMVLALAAALCPAVETQERDGIGAQRTQLIFVFSEVQTSLGQRPS